MRRALGRAKRKHVLAVAAVLAFVVVLALWVGRAPGSDERIALPAGPGPSASGLSSVAPTGDPTPSPSGAAASGSPIPGAFTLPPLSPINGSNNIQDASKLHAVTLDASSDKPILQVAWAVRSGQPPTGYRTFVRQSFTVRSPATGDGILAQLAVQATSDATYIKCTIRIDGVVKNTRTVKGAYSVAFCVA